MIQSNLFYWVGQRFHGGFLLGLVQLKHHDQNNLGKKHFIWFTLLHHSWSSKEFKRRTQARQQYGGWSWCRSHGWGLPIDLLSMTCSGYFVIEVGLPDQGWLHHRRAEPSYINPQLRKWSISLLTVWYYRGFFSVDTPPFKWSICSIVTKPASILFKTYIVMQLK